jgi:hypothetical protein
MQCGNTDSCRAGRITIESARLRLSACLLLLSVPVAAAAEPPGVEVTVFGGYRTGGSFEIRDADGRFELDDAAERGLILNLPHSAETRWELIYAAEDTHAEAAGTGLDRVALETRLLQVGGIYLFAAEGMQPYLAATVGATRITTRAETVEDDTFLSGSLGLGLRVRPSARVGLRLEVRLHGALTRRDTDLFCSTGPDVNACAIRIEGSMLGQVSAFAGLSLRF